jgi:hypothetical protein
LAENPLDRKAARAAYKWQYFLENRQPLRFENLFHDKGIANRAPGWDKHYRAIEAIDEARQAQWPLRLPPVYVPIILREVAKSIIEDFKSNPIGGNIRRRLALAAKLLNREIDSLEEAPKNLKSGGMFERHASYIQPPGDEANPFYSVRKSDVHEMNPGKALIARLIEAKQFEAHYNFIKKIQEVGSKQHIPGWTEFNVKEALEGMMKDYPDADMAPILQRLKDGETIWLPPRAAKIAGNLFQKPPDNAFTAAMRKVGRIQTTGWFGLDLTFEIMMALRTNIIMGMTLTGPKDVAAMVLAGRMATNPRAAKLFPAAVLLSHHGYDNPELLQAIDESTHVDPIARTGAKFLNSFQKFFAGKQSMGMEVQNAQRTVLALAHCLEAIDRMEEASDTRYLGKLRWKERRRSSTYEFVRKALDTTTTLNRIAEHLEDPVNMLALHRFLTGTVGDYSTTTYRDMDTIRLVFPTGAYFKHAGDMAKYLPVNYPGKVALMTAISHIIQQEMQADPYGRLPIKEKSGKLSLGPSGGVKYFNGPEVDPLKGGLELAADVYQLKVLLTNPSHFEGLKAPGSLNALVNMAAVAFSGGVDPETGERYSDRHPDFKKVGRDDYVNVWTGEHYTKASSPKWIWAKKLMSKQIAPVQQLLAYPYESTVYTAAPEKWWDPSSYEMKNPATAKGAGYKAAQRRGPYGKPFKGYRPLQNWKESVASLIHMGAKEGYRPMTPAEDTHYHQDRPLQGHVSYP